MTMIVERVHAPSRAEFEERFVARRLPVIITGVVDRWKAATRWTDLEYLKRRCGTRRVRFVVAPGGDFLRARAGGDTELGQFIDEWCGPPTSTDRGYVTDCQLARLLPELLEDIDDPPFFRPFEREGPAFFRGLFLGRDTFTATHHHIDNQTLTCQVVGTKLALLYPPTQSHLLYSPRFSSASPVDPRHPDLARFPRFAATDPSRAELRPGDMLYIPPHWWHFVESPGFAITIACTYPAPLRHWHFPTPGLESLVMMAMNRTRKFLGGPNVGKYQQWKKP